MRVAPTYLIHGMILQLLVYLIISVVILHGLEYSLQLSKQIDPRILIRARRIRVSGHGKGFSNTRIQ
jgi:hypothetical protein